MKTVKYLILAALAIGIAIMSIKLTFKRKYYAFVQSIEQYEIAQSEKFKEEKEAKVNGLLATNRTMAKLFIKQFEENKGMIERDTVFSFFFIKRSVKYNDWQFAYLECLNSKCSMDIQNYLAQNHIKAKESELATEFGETFDLWYPQLKNEKLVMRKSMPPECNSFFPNAYEFSYDESRWNDFEAFMTYYNDEIQTVKFQNAKVRGQFNQQSTEIIKQLNGNVRNSFKEKLLINEDRLLTAQTEKKTFDAPALGSIAYTIEKTTFDENLFKTIVEQAYIEQWKRMESQ